MLKVCPHKVSSVFITCTAADIIAPKSDIISSPLYEQHENTDEYDSSCAKGEYCHDILGNENEYITQQCGKAAKKLRYFIEQTGDDFNDLSEFITYKVGKTDKAVKETAEYSFYHTEKSGQNRAEQLTYFLEDALTICIIS